MAAVGGRMQPRPPRAMPPPVRRAGYGQPAAGNAGRQAGASPFDPSRVATVGARRPPPAPPAQAAQRALAAKQTDSDVPSFIGAASRKRKWEIAAERGLVPPLGHSANDPFAHHGYHGGGGRNRPGPSSKFVSGAKGGRGQQEPAEEWGSKRQKQAPLGKGGGKGHQSVQFLKLPLDAAFVQSGLPETGPVVAYSADTQGLMWAAPDVLAALGVSAEAVQINDDADWTQYPDVGAALKRATGEEVAMCVAEYAEAAIWAVGTGNKWKQREQAARLALALALAANTEDFSALARSQPEFTALCRTVGINTGPAQGRQQQQQQQRVNKATPYGGGSNGHQAEGGAASAKQLPKDKPMWINLSDCDEVIPDALALCLPEAIALCTDGGRKSLYSKVDAAIAHFIGDAAEDAVEYHDDPNWDVFPAVGSAVKRSTKQEVQQCVAICPSAGAWAVGVGGKVKMRQMAAKAALAATLALQLVEMGQDVDYSEFPALQQFVEEAQAAKTKDE